MKSSVKLLMAIAALLAAATVAAQVYRWVDKDGKVQYTDTPPPPDLKGTAKKIDTRPASGGVSVSSPAASKGPDTKAADKRKADEEKEKKAAADSEAAAADEENCREARAALNEYESGKPLLRTDENGERKLVNDDERQSRIQKAKAAIAASCK